MPKPGKDYVELFRQHCLAVSGLVVMDGDNDARVDVAIIAFTTGVGLMAAPSGVSRKMMAKVVTSVFDTAVNEIDKIVADRLRRN